MSIWLMMYLLGVGVAYILAMLDIYKRNKPNIGHLLSPLLSWCTVCFVAYFELFGDKTCNVHNRK